MLSSVQCKLKKDLVKVLKAIKSKRDFLTSIPQTSTTANQSISPWHTKVDYLSHCLEAGAGAYPLLYLKPNSPTPNKINERSEMRLVAGWLQADCSVIIRGRLYSSCCSVYLTEIERSPERKKCTLSMA